MIVNEIYSSIEGEGNFQGIPTIFIRFQGCDLRCAWCDTPHAQSRITGGLELTTTEILEKVKALEKETVPYIRVSLTGGDPLCQDSEQLMELIKRLSKHNSVHMEHSGIQHNVNEQAFLSAVDSIAYDIKPPSAKLPYDTNYHDWIKELDFDNTKVEFKAVFADCADIDFIAKTWDMLKPNKGPLCLQPCIPYASVKGLTNEEQIRIREGVNYFITLYDSKLYNARLGCQLHKVLGLD